MNLDIVQKQIQAITFVQGTIATIRNRIIELILPIPSNINKRKEISAQIKEIIDIKTKTRQKMQELSFDLL